MGATSRMYQEMTERNHNEIDFIMQEQETKKYKMITPYLKTKNGLVSQFYSYQKSKSKIRGHHFPNYTKVEFKEWLFNHKNFDWMFDDWTKSGYDKALKPSIDRLDDYKGYTFDNIQLITVSEHYNKSGLDRINGINNKTSISVFQLTIENKIIKEFYSMKDAERGTGVHQGSIGKCCSGISKTAGGYKWKYKN